MVTIVKSEWHSVEKRYALVITEDDLTEIYPEHDETEIASLMEEIKSGDFDYGDRRLLSPEKTSEESPCLNLCTDRGQDTD